MKKRSWVNNGYIGLVMAFLYAPIIVMAVFSFNESSPAPSGQALPSTGIKSSSPMR